MNALTEADQISEIAFGFMGSKALFAALQSGVFTALEGAPADAATRPINNTTCTSNKYCTCICTCTV